MPGPIESTQLRFPYSSARVDVSLWEGRERDGKPLPSNVSIRIQDAEKNAVYLDAKDALSIAALLQNYSARALQRDAKRRLEAWRERTGNADAANADLDAEKTKNAINSGD